MDPESSGVPEAIGPYRVLRELGRGGMGVVYLAEQAEPVPRRVAIKLIAPLKRSELVARFRTEARTLARLQHPGIAQVHDYGETSDGIPYLVLEHVVGQPIDVYCDERRLELPDRIRLFLDLCAGVEHCHQKGVLHRDLKPPNVLVTEVDGRPRPKIIDFGVAKDLEEETLLTIQGEVFGTFRYLSPEQLESAADVDTRADVYSLGVVLFELLVGRDPFRADSGSFADLVRRKTTGEAEPPSRAVSGSLADDGDKAQRIADARRIDLERLADSLEGDLDAIVLTALERDPDRRYPSVGALAEDLDRHLHHLPVRARPPTARERVAKFVRRHRTGVAFATAGLLLLLAAFAVTLVSLAHARASEWRAVAASELARREAEDHRATAGFLEDLLGAIDPAVDGPDVRLRDVVDRRMRRLDAEEISSPAVEASIREAAGRAYLGLGLGERALELARAAEALRRGTDGAAAPRTLDVRELVAEALGAVGRPAEAVEVLDEVLAAREASGDPTATAATRCASGRSLVAAGRYDEALDRLRTAVSALSVAVGPEAGETLGCRMWIAVALRRLGRFEESETMLRDLAAIHERRFGPVDPATLQTRNALANVLFSRAEYPEAAALYRETLAHQERVLGPDHPGTLLTRNNLGSVLYKEGAWEEAETLYRATWEVQRATLGPEHPHSLLSANNVANALRRLGRLEEAETLYRRTREAQSRVLGPSHQEAIRTGWNLLTVLETQGRRRDALAAADLILAEAPDAGPIHLRRGRLLLDLGRPADALGAAERAVAGEASFDASVILGRALFALGRTEEALETWRAAIADAGPGPHLEAAAAQVRDGFGRADGRAERAALALFAPASADAEVADATAPGT